jgi:hypothetical protein
MPEIDIRIKTNRRVNPMTGDYQAIATRITAKAPVIAFRSTQALVSVAKMTAPQPPRKAWWYTAPPNPRTGKVVPPHEQYVRTGELADSIIGPLKLEKNVYGAYVEAPFAAFVEYGTRFMPPQRFWGNAVTHVRKNVLPASVKTWLRRGPV